MCGELVERGRWAPLFFLGGDPDSRLRLTAHELITGLRIVSLIVNRTYMPLLLLGAVVRGNNCILEPKSTIFVRVILELVIYSITRRSR